MEIHQIPLLRSPIMVIACGGWSDAGEAATGTISHLLNTVGNHANDALSTGELIAEIDGIKASRRPQRKAVAQELESQHTAPTVQTVPNPTQGVGVPRGDTRH